MEDGNYKDVKLEVLPSCSMKDTLQDALNYINLLEKQCAFFTQLPNQLLSNIHGFEFNEFVKSSEYVQIQKPSIENCKLKLESIITDLANPPEYSKDFKKETDSVISDAKNHSISNCDIINCLTDSVEDQNEMLKMIYFDDKQSNDTKFSNKIINASANTSSCSTNNLPPLNKISAGGVNNLSIKKEPSDHYENFDCDNFNSTGRHVNDNIDEFKNVFAHTDLLKETLRSKFGLKMFRPLQEEIINASLLQHDCLVLMATGGGKSLCYQLPAVLVPGVTIVISPLQSLICDQVDKLNAYDIAAAHLCSNIEKAEANAILSKLNSQEPLLKLLYLTPEKIMASRVVKNAIMSLYKRKKLVQFVVDEVHCVSQWGHDFRPDYRQLSCLKRFFPEIPIMGLTATATPRVKEDIKSVLQLSRVKVFRSSFNRANICYRILAKQKETVAREIGELIKRDFNKQSGIVYCLSRADTDQLAQDLRTMGIKARSYHAGLESAVRDRQQRQWMQDEFHVVVATIAFGMGIDKANVRFVIHNAVPSSVEAFYQESGRAGRDGEISYSYLFYSCKDISRLQRLISCERTDKVNASNRLSSLQNMAMYCENVVDCRRELLLRHFGEVPMDKLCLQNKTTSCDNCLTPTKHEFMDITRESRELAQIVKDITKKNDKLTLSQVILVYKGSKVKKILEQQYNDHKYYGSGNKMEESLLQRILRHLVFHKYLKEECSFIGDFCPAYISVGPKIDDLLLKGETILLTKAVRQSYKQSTTSKQNTANINCKPSVLEITKLKHSCHEELLEVCRQIAVERGVTMSSVMNLSAIKIMSEEFPNTKDAFMKVQHVTEANYAKYGEAFLKVTSEYNAKLVKLTEVKESFEFDDLSQLPSTSRGVKRKRQVKYKKGRKRKSTKRVKARKRTTSKSSTGTSTQSSSSQSKNKFLSLRSFLQ